MDRHALLRTASRHRIVLLAVLGLSVAGSFSQNATRALFLLPGQPPAAFAAIIQPAGEGAGQGDFGGRGARRLIPPRRGGPGGAPGATPPPAAAGAPGVGIDEFRPEGSPGTLQNVSDPAGGGGGGPGGNGFVPGTAPLVGGGGGGLPPSSAPTNGPVEITPAVPEPPAWLLGLGGLALLGAARQLRRRLAPQAAAA